MNIQKYYNFFQDYTNNYINNSKNNSDIIHLTRKKDHSYRVAELSLKIGHSLNLDSHDIFLLNIISLFHDLGRFPQFKKYHTYDDLKSENHAILSLKIIDESNILSELQNNEIQLIKKCIYWHNEPDIPSTLDSKEYLLSTILRDADKIDFFKGMIDIIPNLPKEEQKIFYSNKEETNILSDNVYHKILNQKIIYNKEIQSKLDKQVRSLGFITSDMHYKKSFKIIYENNYIEKIYKLLPKNKKTKEIYQFVKNYILKELNIIL